MVKISTSLTNSGFRDWLLQRFSAIVLLFYFSYLFYFFMLGPVDYTLWLGLFESLWMQGATFIAGVSLILHIYIGMWTVATDYIKPGWPRLSFIGLMVLYLLLLLYSLLYILWGL